MFVRGIRTITERTYPIKPNGPAIKVSGRGLIKRPAAIIVLMQIKVAIIGLIFFIGAFGKNVFEFRVEMPQLRFVYRTFHPQDELVLYETHRVVVGVKAKYLRRGFLNGVGDFVEV